MTGLGLVSLGLGLAGLGWPRPRSHCLMVSLASLVSSLVLLHTLTRRTSDTETQEDFTRHQEQRPRTETNETNTVYVRRMKTFDDCRLLTAAADL